MKAKKPLIRDTLSGELKEVEVPVRIYSCGPTVYSRIHIGNARPFIIFALYKHFLDLEGFETIWVSNLTDVNEKIDAQAEKQGVTSEEWSSRMSKAYIEDTNRLALGRPDHEPRATEMRAAIISLIEELIKAGHAYHSEGDVYFKVENYPAYGELSHQELENMMSQGEDDDIKGRKSHPQDFALWKSKKKPDRS